MKDSAYEGLAIGFGAVVMLLIAFAVGSSTAYRDGYSQGYSDAKASIPHLYRKDVKP